MSEQPSLPGAYPSYRTWFASQWKIVEDDGIRRNATERGRIIAQRTPLHLLNDAAYTKAVTMAATWLRRDGGKAVPVAGGGREILPPQQLELWQVTDFLVLNAKRRIADAESEKRFVAEWCSDNPDYTLNQVYEVAGLAPPA